MIAAAAHGIGARLKAQLTRPGREPGRSIGLLILRVSTGAALLGAHALPKGAEMWAGDGAFPQLVAQLGFPLPTASAWLATGFQLVGSAMIILGVLTPLGALAVFSTLVVGVFAAHWGEPFSHLEVGVAYMTALAAIGLLGPGQLSLDAKLFGASSPSSPD